MSFPTPLPNPVLVPMAAVAPARRRRTGVRRVVLALAAAAVALAGCQGVGGGAPGDAWTEAQVAQVFDLSELGRVLTIAPSGDHLLLDGRTLLPEVLERFPQLTMGRTTNLLRFADDALAAMAPEAQAFVLRAAPAELREHLAAYGLTLTDVRAAWAADGQIDLAGLRMVAARLDAAGGPTTSARQAGDAPGSRLLADLGVPR